MKKLLLFIGTLFCLNYSYGQIAYYDAQTLKTLMNTAQKFDTTAGQKAAIKAILKKYAPNVPDAAVFSVFNDNPFF